MITPAGRPPRDRGRLPVRPPSSPPDTPMTAPPRSSSLGRQLVLPAVGLLLAGVLATVAFASWLAARRAAWQAPDGPLAGTCIARIQLPPERCPAGIGGPTPVALRPDGAYDLLPFGPTVADLLERPDLLALATRTDLRRVADLAELVAGSPADARRPDRPIGGMIGMFGSMLRATRKNSISGATMGCQPSAL